MDHRVQVVTDSAAGLPAVLAAAEGIVVVELPVSPVGTDQPEVGADPPVVRPPESWGAPDRPGPRWSTSRPPLAAFERAYASPVGGEAGGGVVSVHLSGALSGTVAAAERAAWLAGQRGSQVEVVDSGQLGMGVGFAALAAARAARDGADLATCTAAARRSAASTCSWLYLDSIEQLHRGGRLLGVSVRGLTTELGGRPLLAIQRGVLVPLERTRTRSRAVMRLAELAAAAVGQWPAGIGSPPRAGRVGSVDFAVSYLGVPEAAQRLAGLLREQLSTLRGGSVRECYLTELPPVIAAHTGPGAVGLSVHRVGSSAAWDPALCHDRT